MHAVMAAVARRGADMPELLPSQLFELYSLGRHNLRNRHAWYDLRFRWRYGLLRIREHRQLFYSVPCFNFESWISCRSNQRCAPRRLHTLENNVDALPVIAWQRAARHERTRRGDAHTMDAAAVAATRHGAAMPELFPSYLGGGYRNGVRILRDRRTRHDLRVHW